MRVITGTARGRKLREPEGMASRPTTPIMSRSLCSTSSSSTSRDGACSTSLPAPVSSASRRSAAVHAAPCSSMRARAAVQLVRTNLAHCRLQGDVVQGEALGYLRTCGKFDLIFLDPPYDTGLLDKALANVVQFDILAEGGIIVCESRREKELPQLPRPYYLLTERSYGKIKLTLYGKGTHA